MALKNIIIQTAVEDHGFNHQFHVLLKQFEYTNILAEKDQL